MINYSFNIKQLTVDTTNPIRPNHVVYVVCDIKAVDEATQTQVQRWSAFAVCATETFTFFEELTESQVRGWVESHESWPFIQAEMADQINSILNPEKVAMRPPWEPEPVVTTATSTATIANSVEAQEIYLRALIYEIIDEIKDSTV